MVSSILVHSQEVSDSITVIKKEKKKNKVKFLFVLDARRSFVLDKKTKFNGFKLGVSIKERHRLGLGVYGMQNPIRLPGLQIDKQEYPDASDTLLFNFNYTSIFYQPVLFVNKRWEISTPHQLGIGKIRLYYRDTTDTKDVLFLEGAVPMFTVSSVFQFKIFRWIGLGLGVGYRMAISSDDDVKNAVNAPFYNFQLKVFLGEIYRMTFKKDQLEEW